MNTDEQIEALTQSVRAIGAQHLAMKAILRAALPFLPIGKSERAAVTAAAFDALAEELSEAGTDDEFQQIAFEEFEALRDLVVTTLFETEADRPTEQPPGGG